ncbi:MAG: hypothetical protein ACRDR6_09535 [Pseudonocardiaceae bacterium]
MKFSFRPDRRVRQRRRHARTPQPTAALTATLPMLGGAVPVWWVASALALSLSVITVTESGHGGPLLATARVVRGTVTSTVTGTGSLHAITEQKLGFPAGGRLTELDVSVGDRVTPGEILAKVDNTAQQVLLRKTKDEVVKQQAVLDQIKAGNQAEGSVAELNRYRDLLSAAQDATVQTDRADAAAIGQDVRELEFDRADLARNLRQLQIDQRLCDNSGGLLGLGTPSPYAAPSPPPTPPPPPTTPIPSTLPTPPAPQTPPTSPTIGITGANLTACEDAENRRDLVADAQRRIIQDEAAIDAAQKKRDLDRSVQQSVIDAARLNVTVAENKAGLASTDRRYNIEEEQQVVDQAEADVVTAQHAFDATIMKSSFSGIVERINGNVGQVVNASYNTASPASARQPSGGAFIVLKNVNSFQLVLPFSQADVAGMQPNQPAEVSFDDIARLSRKGIVTSIEPAQPAMGANTTYLVTVVLTELDPSLKDGMTAQAHLVISAVDNVLVVPTSAVHRHGRISTVSVLQSDGKQRDVPVELGEAGKETTHVVSGIREGDQVVLPRG